MLGPMMRALALSLGLALGPMAAPAGAVPCGGSFARFLEGLEAEAPRHGVRRAEARAFLNGGAQEPAVLRADRAKSFFQLDFLAFAGRLISANRLQRGAQMAGRWAGLFEQIEARGGVSRGVLLALWAFETDYGAVQGETNTRNALLTLAHDCRRPELFRPQVFAAMQLAARGDLDPATTTGAWAGEVGMVQMLPADILAHGVDGDGDGHVRLKTSAPDALMSAAHKLRALGWAPGQPWLHEVVLPAGGLDWAQTGLAAPRKVRDWQRAGLRGRNGPLGPGGLEAALLLPMGRNGPAFLAYPNFEVLLEWNRSLTYVTTTAYFATRLEGAPPLDPRAPDAGLSGEEMRTLQRALAARGHDVGDVDGILGEKTRAAVRAEQARLGWPADAWPTPALVQALR